MVGSKTTPALGIALSQLDEEFQGGVIDTPALKGAAFGVEDTKTLYPENGF